MEDNLESRIKNVIARLRVKRGWPIETKNMTLDTPLNAHHIYILRRSETGLIQRWRGQYIPFKDFLHAVQMEFGIPLSHEYKEKRLEWKTIGDVVDHVRNRETAVEVHSDTGA